MKEYPKIETLLNRDPKTFKVITNQWRLPEFEYLQNNSWLWVEKIDGTNIRVAWDAQEKKITLGGRTDNAQTPTFLIKKLQELFTVEKLAGIFPKQSMILFGEGYGARIQKGGGNYISNGVDFALFDVLVGDWWLKFVDIEDVAVKLRIKAAPLISSGNLNDAIKFTQHGFNSAYGNFQAEGLVLRPYVDLMTRSGHRLIAKIKTKDF